MGLSGPLPPSLGAQEHMTDLYLENNRFSGTLPAEWANMGILSSDLEMYAEEQLLLSHPLALPVLWFSKRLYSSCSCDSGRGLSVRLRSCMQRRPQQAGRERDQRHPPSVLVRTPQPRKAQCWQEQAGWAFAAAMVRDGATGISPVAGKSAERWPPRSME